MGSSSAAKCTAQRRSPNTHAQDPLQPRHSIVQVTGAVSDTAPQWRHAIYQLRHTTMTSTSTDILHSIRAATSGLSLAELLAAHPGVARRTAQRWIAK